MNRQDLATLFCKILGIFFFVKSLEYFSTAIVVFSTSRIQTSVDPQSFLRSAAFLSNVFFLCTPFIAAGLLWFGANRLAVAIFPEAGESIKFITDNRTLPLIFISVGIVVFALTLPHFVSHIWRYFSLSNAGIPSKIEMKADIIADLLQICLALWLMLGTENILQIFQRLNHTSVSSKSTFKEKL